MGIDNIEDMNMNKHMIDIDFDLINESERFVSNVMMQYEQQNCSSLLLDDNDGIGDRSQNRDKDGQQRRQQLGQRRGRGMKCMCGLLHDIATSSILIHHHHEDD